MAVHIIKESSDSKLRSLHDDADSQLSAAYKCVAEMLMHCRDEHMAEYEAVANEILNQKYKLNDLILDNR